MSTFTITRLGPVRKIAQTLANFAAILGVWFLLAAGLTLVPGVTNSVLVPFPQKAMAGNLPNDVTILRWDDGMAVLYSERRGYVADLYKSGVALVLPARKSGCVDLRKKAA